MEPDALKRAGRAFRYWEARQEAVAHNLANASTPGFKGERVFAKLLAGVGVEPQGQIDLQAGGLTDTGRPLDLALDGDGFMVVETHEGERLVRGGSFQMDVTRTLVDAQGNALLSDSGPIMLPEGEFEITSLGEIRVNGATVASLRVDRPNEDAKLWREGGTRFRLDGDSETVERGEVKVRQGHLEESNVDPVGSLVDMIEIQRAYSALQRAVLVVDGVMDRVSNDLGRVK
jgi:flagellar basal body rod protein FlgG